MHAQETKIYTAIIIAVFVIGTVVYYFFYAMLKQHRKMLSLQKQYATAQVTVLEKDRSRIAADLHDELAPMLVAVKMKINSFDLENETDKKYLLSANHTIDEIARRMRGISFDLMPSALREKGLQTAVHEFVNTISSKNDLIIHFAPETAAVELSEAATIHLYRVVQEIIHNTLKHARASQLSIVLKKQKNYLVIASRDNGTGFDHQQKLKQATGLGLPSLMNRIHLLNGEFLIDSKEGVGTAITIQIPLDNEQTLLANKNTDS
jgi:signal transduction histidine kinase